MPAQPETRCADDEILRATLFSGWYEIEIVRDCMLNMLHCGTLSRKALGERRWLKLFLPENMEEALNVVCWLPRK